MGLDWRPLNKPKEGYEDEFEEIFNILSGRAEKRKSLINKIIGNKAKGQEELLDRFLEISIFPL